MRNRKFVKPLLIVVAMILVCIMSVFATLAYLTDDTEVVKNTFTVGNIEIDLDEADVTIYGEYEYKMENGEVVEDQDGNPVKADRVFENDYKLVPNRQYVKDPSITVKALSEDCYLRAFITVTKYDALTKLGYTADVNTETNFLKKFKVALGEEWTAYACKYDAANDAFVFEVRYNKVVEYNDKADQFIPVFTSFTTDDLNNEELGTLKGMKIDVIAQAIQADTFADAAAAFAALDEAV